MVKNYKYKRKRMDDTLRYYTISGRNVIVYRRPDGQQSNHEITLGPGGVHVVCCHKKLDLDVIEKQVMYLANKKLL